MCLFGVYQTPDRKSRKERNVRTVSVLCAGTAPDRRLFVPASVGSKIALYLLLHGASFAAGDAWDFLCHGAAGSLER